MLNAAVLFVWFLTSIAIFIGMSYFHLSALRRDMSALPDGSGIWFFGTIGRFGQTLGWDKKFIGDELAQEKFLKKQNRAYIQIVIAEVLFFFFFWLVGIPLLKAFSI